MAIQSDLNNMLSNFARLSGLGKAIEGIGKKGDESTPKIPTTENKKEDPNKGMQQKQTKTKTIEEINQKAAENVQNNPGYDRAVKRRKKLEKKHPDAPYSSYLQFGGDK